MRQTAPRVSAIRLFSVLSCLALLGPLAISTAKAGFFRNQAVGGVSIDAKGVLKNPTIQDMKQLREEIEAQLDAVPDGIDTALTMRKVSLRGLEEAMRQAGTRDVAELPDEIKYVAGLQRVQYILVYPEHQDIVLVGPAEGWRVSESGAVVGKTTGRPVLHLEDLIVAMRTVSAAEGPMSCSIDATAEGIQAMREFTGKQRVFSPQAVQGIAKALGPQQITISGVAENSHFARVLVAADYRMKRIAMQLEESPVPELPSFLSMLQNSRVKLGNMMPRWWIACDYEPLARSEDGLAWELRGRGARVMTEDDHIADDGTVTHTGQENPIAARWAETMTREYDALSKQDAVFGQLRNVMDISVVAALIHGENLLQRANCDIPILTGKKQDLALPSWNPPKSVDTQCSFVKRGREYLITASGGVEINPWRYASKSQVSPHVAQVRSETTGHGDRWWW